VEKKFDDLEVFPDNRGDKSLGDFEVLGVGVDGAEFGREGNDPQFPQHPVAGLTVGRVIDHLNRVAVEGFRDPGDFLPEVMVEVDDSPGSVLWELVGHETRRSSPLRKSRMA